MGIWDNQDDNGNDFLAPRPAAAPQGASGEQESAEPKKDYSLAEVAVDAGIVDLTNQPNNYQGSLRFAYLDHDLLEKAIRLDLADAAGSGVQVSASLAVTCLDQVDSQVNYYAQGARQSGTVQAQLTALSNQVLPVNYQSWGPSRQTIQKGAVS